jgi:hypothetical protein
MFSHRVYKSRSLYNSLQDLLANAQSSEQQQDAILNFLDEKKCFPADFKLNDYMQEKKQLEHIRSHLAKQIMLKIEAKTVNDTQTDQQFLEICKKEVNNYKNSAVAHRLDDYIFNDYDDDDFGNESYDFRPRNGSW